MTTTESTTHPKYRPDIDGLRAIAVLSVIGFHAFPDWIKAGFVGVDIFFVISGFLISSIIFKSLEHRSFSYLDFYARRIRRIFPALIVVLLSCLIVGWFILLPFEYAQLGKQVGAGTVFISNIVLWYESGYFDAAAELKPLLHLWSLGIEEQFYIVWPLLMALLWKRMHKLWLVVATLLLLSFGLNAALIDRLPVAVFYFPVTRFWELLFGSLLGYIALFHGKWIPVSFNMANGVASGTSTALKSRKVVSESLAWVGTLLLAAAFVFIDREKAFPGWWAVLPVLSIVCLIAAGPQTWINRTILSNRMVVFVGLISYPLYLWHWPLLAFARIIESGTPSQEIRSAAVAGSFVLAWLTYRLVEKPLRFGNFGKQGNVKLIGLCLGMTAVGLAGAFVFQQQGFVTRYPKQIEAIASFKFDPMQNYREGICYLSTSQNFSTFVNECTGGLSIVNDSHESPLILLWGDSHAAHLYPGLNALKETHKNLRLAQYTESGCPPVLGMQIAQRKNCKGVNDFVFDKVKTLKPDVVVLAGHWIRYNGKAGWDALDLVAFQQTVQAIKAAGVKRVVIFGHVPVWQVDQPKVILNVWKKSQMMPERTKLFLDSAAAAMDLKMRAVTAGLDAVFVSPMDLLCNAQGCLLFGDAKNQIPLAWDYGHLTSAGSRLLVHKAEKEILGVQ